MTRVIKLQKIGNSIRATIPKEVVEALSLKEGERMVVTKADDSVVLKKRGARKMVKFYGVLKERTGKVEHWPTPEEIKSIWE